MPHVMDSTGKPINVGDRVKFRGGIYTIKRFMLGNGRAGVATIEFEEAQNVAEVADELSVDLVERRY